MPPGAPGARTYLLAAAAAGVGLGVRRRAAAAPGRGVKVPGIILVHDPRWGPERKQGVFLPPPALRPPRARSPRAGAGLRSLPPGFSPTAAGADRAAAIPGSSSPERRAPHSFPALRAPRDRPSTQCLPLKSRRVPPSRPCARPRPRAPAELRRDRRPEQDWEIKTDRGPGEPRVPGLGPRVPAGH